MTTFGDIYFEALEIYTIARDGAMDELNRPDCDEYVSNALVELSESCRRLCEIAAERANNG
jgi:hypothetical protein